MKNKLTAFIICSLFFACNSSNNKEVSHPNIKNENPELQESINRGADIYLNFCSTCHMPNGKGVPKVFPPLASSDYLLTKRIESIKAIKYGLSEEIIVNNEKYNTPMASLGLSDTEVADVMNYISNSWGNQNNSIVTAKEVSEIKP